MIKLDLTNIYEVQTFINNFKPHAIIHCAAEKRVEAVENQPEASANLNVNATENLAKICAEKGIKFVYVSTDYVFDGTQPPYRVDAVPKPLNKYAETKLAGESVTLKHNQDHCVVRVPVLYGQTETNAFHESAINILIKPILKGEVYKVDDVLIRFPTHVRDVGRFIQKMLAEYFQGNNEIRGILHCSASQAYTKYEMSCCIADLFGVNKEHIIRDMSAIEDVSLTRPVNSQLCTDYSYSLIGFENFYEFEKSIKECLENFLD